MKAPVLAHLLAVAALALFVSACGPRWTVVRQAVPNPFVGQSHFMIEPIHFDHLLVGGKPEPEYLAGKEQDQQQSWAADKTGMATVYAESLVAAGEGLEFPATPTQGAMVVRPIVSFVEPGFYAFAARATEVQMTVQLLNMQGQVLDEIRIHSAVGASMYNPAAGTRMRQAAKDLGRVTADYLQKRVAR